MGTQDSSRYNISVGVDRGHSKIFLNKILSVFSNSLISFSVTLYQASELKRRLFRNKEFLKIMATSKKVTKTYFFQNRHYLVYGPHTFIHCRLNIFSVLAIFRDAIPKVLFFSYFFNFVFSFMDIF